MARQNGKSSRQPHPCLWVPCQTLSVKPQEKKKAKQEALESVETPLPHRWTTTTTPKREDAFVKETMAVSHSHAPKSGRRMQTRVFVGIVEAEAKTSVRSKKRSTMACEGRKRRTLTPPHQEAVAARRTRKRVSHLLLPPTAGPHAARKAAPHYCVTPPPHQQ